MGNFEKVALSTAPTHRKFGIATDDTFTKMQTAKIDSFTRHINSTNSHIKFTREQEEDGKLPFS